MNLEAAGVGGFNGQGEGIEAGIFAEASCEKISPGFKSRFVVCIAITADLKNDDIEIGIGGGIDGIDDILSDTVGVVGGFDGSELKAVEPDGTCFGVGLGDMFDTALQDDEEREKAFEHESHGHPC